MIDLDGGRLLLVVGDVSGRGLRAATTMAELRYAIRAYAAQGDGPAEILTKISRLVSVAESGQLATVLCATVDMEARQLSITSAGHLPPLLLANGDSHYLRRGGRSPDRSGGGYGVPVDDGDRPSRGDGRSPSPMDWSKGAGKASTRASTGCARRRPAMM